MQSTTIGSEAWTNLSWRRASGRQSQPQLGRMSFDAGWLSMGAQCLGVARVAGHAGSPLVRGVAPVAASVAPRGEWGK